MTILPRDSRQTTLTTADATLAAIVCAWGAQCERIEEVGQRVQFVLVQVPADYERRLLADPFLCSLREHERYFDREIRRRRRKTLS